MNGRALVFPGQGAQHPGMAAAIVDRFESARAVMERAGEVLGFDVGAICRDGPESRLEATDVCQPAILATSAAVMEALREASGIRATDFQAAAGLSLGEYTALWYAGSLSLEDALVLVRRRGQAMQAASEAVPCGMLSLLGASREAAQRIVEAAAGDEVLVAANFLAPGQVVISGARSALDRAETLAREHGVRRAIRLKVAGAFHSPLMASATEALREALARVDIRPPRIPFYTNVTGEAVSDPEQIRRHLAEQVTHPVLWEEIMRAFVHAGVRRLVEPAPGRVLCGLMKKVSRDVECVGVESVDDVVAFARDRASAGENRTEDPS